MRITHCSDVCRCRAGVPTGVSRRVPPPLQRSPSLCFVILDKERVGWKRLTFLLDSRAAQANTALVKFSGPRVSTILTAFLLWTTGRTLAKPVQSAQPARHASQTEIQTYSRARTVMDWTPEEIKGDPSLYKVRPDGQADKLPLILDQVGKSAAAMIAEFRNIACEERVYSEWNQGSPILTFREMGPNEVTHHFLYIIIPRPAGDPQMFKEYRTDPKGKPIDLGSLSDLLLITTNFTGSWAYFNSSNQPESRFRYFGEQTVRRKPYYVVGFAQRPDIARNYTTFEAGGRSAAILVQGLAWIDARSFHIVKMETWLLAPRQDVGLESQDTTVNYLPIRPAGLNNDLWLPNEVKVLVHYHDIFVRNTHRYSGFKLFQAHAVITH
jgi:hypothetical protein